MSSMTQKIISFDPGKVTGVAEGVFTDTDPLTVTAILAIPYEELLEGFTIIEMEEYDHVVVEEFTLRTNNEFAADLTGVRVEGLLQLAYGDQIVWRSRTTKEQVPDKVLKDHDLWVTGTEVDWSDGRDVNDAIKHMVGHVALTLKHRPTLEAYFRD